jgi:hypothetical protein
VLLVDRLDLNDNSVVMESIFLADVEHRRLEMQPGAANCAESAGRPTSKRALSRHSGVSHDGEVALFECRDVVGAESFASSDHGCVDGAEREIAVVRHAVGDAHPIGGCDWFHDEVACGQIPEEPHLWIHTESCAQEVDDFGDVIASACAGAGRRDRRGA